MSRRGASGAERAPRAQRCRPLALSLAVAAAGLSACASRPPPLSLLLSAVPMASFDVVRAAPFDTLDAPVRELMAHADVTGLALAVIRNGRVVYTQAYGLARRADDSGPAQTLRTDTVMYGASLTKAAFAHLVMQLVDAGQIDLDRPLPQQLRRPLPEYDGFADLAADPRWRLITPRMLLSHSSGLPNWRWLITPEKLGFHAEPGERYIYSGEGLQVMQLVVEERSGRPLAELMQQRIFDRVGMPDTSMVWRADFASRVPMGYDVDGSARPQPRSRRARAAGSMLTTVQDYANFMAGVMRGEGLSAAAQREMLSPQIGIVSPQQFPSHFPGRTAVNEAIGLAGGLGWVVHRSPHGPVFFKEGNSEGTNNFAIGFPARGDGLVLLSNSSRADRMFIPLVELLFAPSCLPWFWMGYVPWDRSELRRSAARQQPLGPDAACLDALARR